MTKFQRIENIAAGIVMILCAAVLLHSPEEGLPFLTTILSISLTLAGLRFLIYYFTMARYMVGGRNILYTGVIVLDFGLFTYSIVDERGIIIILYLLSLHVFFAVVNLVKGIRERRSRVPYWKVDAVQGIVNLLIAGASVAFIHSIRIIVCLYCAGLFYSAAGRIYSAFRRTAIVYIQ